MPKFHFGWGSAPDPARGAYSAPPEPIAGGRGLAAPYPRTPRLRPRFSALRASDFGAFGASLSPKYHYSPNTGAARIHTAREVVWQATFSVFLTIDIRKPQYDGQDTSRSNTQERSSYEGMEEDVPRALGRGHMTWNEAEIMVSEQSCWHQAAAQCALSHGRN